MNIRRRGRRKKSEIVSFSIVENQDSEKQRVTFNESELSDSRREKSNISFGELNIVVHSAQEDKDAKDLQLKKYRPSERNIFSSSEEIKLDQTECRLESKECIIDCTTTGSFPEIPEIDIIENTTENTTKTNPKKSINKNSGTVYTYNPITEITDVLPKETKEWCWWCCHSFKNRPAYLTTRYDDKRDRFYVKGNFCSWNCVKAYNHDKKDNKMPYRAMCTALLVKKLHGRMQDIKSAPPRETLKVFGGNLSIQEFRSNDIYINETHFSSVLYTKTDFQANKLKK